MIKIKSDKIIVGNTLFDGCVYVQNGKIVQVTTDNIKCETYDFTGKYLSAGFIDMHTHGAGGYAFVNSSASDVIEACNYHLSYGMTTIVPTVSAGPISVMESALKNISEAKKSGKAKNNILGAHLEGPYLSKNQAGAQCPEFITPPKRADYERLLSLYEGDITRWTYAPELDEDGAFAKALTSRGVVASIGHSDAKYEDVKIAVENGASLITHLYSCTSTVTRDRGFRSLGVVESAYLLDDLFVEIIADGKHLPPPLIQMIMKIKGADKVALITDSLSIAGTDIKQGEMSGIKFIVEDGVCKLMDRSAFAGSVATADMLIKTLVNECGYSIPTAVNCYTKVPAQILGLNKGEIKEGMDADIIVFDEKIQVSDIFVNGEKVK